MNDTEQARARLGTLLCGKWRLESLLGVGGMAAVYAATHRNGLRAAIKMIHRSRAGDAEIVRRFFREAYAANAVGHSGVVRALDDGTAEDGIPFMVQELLEGTTLDEHLRARGGRLPEPDAIRIAAQVLDILVAVHARGIVHRDIKPQNVFLQPDGTAKLLDFGIARLHEQGADETATQLGVVMGTPAFMPPEQALGRADLIDARSDVWAVGALLFRMITGRPVHLGQSMNERLAAAMTRAAAPLHEVATGVHPPVAFVVDRALAFAQSSRWPSAEAMRDALRASDPGAANGAGEDAAVEEAATLPLRNATERWSEAPPLLDGRKSTMPPGFGESGSTMAKGSVSAERRLSAPPRPHGRASWRLVAAVSSLLVALYGLWRVVGSPFTPPPSGPHSAEPPGPSAVASGILSGISPTVSASPVVPADSSGGAPPRVLPGSAARAPSSPTTSTDERPAPPDAPAPTKPAVPAPSAEPPTPKPSATSRPAPPTPPPLPSIRFKEPD